VTVQLDPKLPDFAKGDAGRIRQILLNLGGNAVKFTQQGEVSLEVKVLDSNDHGTHVRCEVRDTGMGIPADRIDALFMPFMQVDASTTRKHGGTGLGLSIVRRLVELMGGDRSQQRDRQGLHLLVHHPACTDERCQAIALCRPRADQRTARDDRG
jgi:two-component system, sensor histidine kinase and response regulator